MRALTSMETTCITHDARSRRVFKAMFLLYRVALAPGRKPHLVRRLFTHEKGDFDAISVKKRSCPAPRRSRSVVTQFGSVGPVLLCGSVNRGIRSFRPKVDSPDSSSPRLSRFARWVFVVLYGWKKGIRMGRQWLHMWNPRLTKIRSRRRRFTML